MVITIAGGGSTFTAGIVKSIALRREELEVDEIRLFDINKERQDKVAVVVDWVLHKELNTDIKLVVTTDVQQAYTDTSFVFAQMRVGGYAMREQDEKIPLRHGCVGQETCGCGGMAYGMRTIFPMIKLIDDVEKYAKKDYWILNYSNPAAIVSEACRKLRTPLTIIVGYLENLMEDDLVEESPGLARKFIGVMHQNSQRLMNIIEDMLMISKLESGHKAILKEQWFRLTSCADDVFSRLDSIREKKQAVLHMDIPTDWELYGDPFYWTQILFNLVENALKQNTEPGLSITVAAAKTQDACVITVTDTGVGIPAESIPFLFNRFYRVETHHSSEIRGTGLGLSIVKRAVEAHDGAITVSSIPHRETVFTITIPLKRFREEKRIRQLSQVSIETSANKST